MGKLQISSNMSNNALSLLERESTIKFASLTEVAKANKSKKVAELVRKVVILVAVKIRNVSY